MTIASTTARLCSTRCRSTFRSVNVQRRIFSNESASHKHVLGKYLFVTNTVVGGVLMGVGDLIQQRIEIYWHSHDKEKHEWSRTENMVGIGCALGSTQHVFYKVLDNVLPGTNFKTVTKKIVIDLVILSPIVITVFLYGLGLLEGRRAGEMHEEVRAKFLPIFLVDCIIWPPIQYVNFAYLHNKHRVIYVNVMMILYDIFLSHIKYEYSPRKKTQ